MEEGGRHVAVPTLCHLTYPRGWVVRLFALVHRVGYATDRGKGGLMFGMMSFLSGHDYCGFAYCFICI